MARRGAGPDAPRGPHRSAGRSGLQPARPVLRRDHDLGVLPGRPVGALALDRRPRDDRAAGPSGARFTGMARSLHRVRWRRLPLLQDALRRRQRQSGLEGLRRGDRRRRGSTGARADRHLRGAGLRLCRQAPARRGAVVARLPRSGEESVSPGFRAQAAVQRRVLDGRGRLLRDGSRLAAPARSARSARTPATAWRPASSTASARAPSPID